MLAFPPAPEPPAGALFGAPATLVWPALPAPLVRGPNWSSAPFSFVQLAKVKPHANRKRNLLLETKADACML
jgi:hypothetical protein